MEWVTLYVYAMTYVGFFSVCILGTLRGNMAWHYYKKDSVIKRLKHVVIDSLIGALFGAIFPAFAFVAIYSYCYDRELVYNKLYDK